ncbi:unnamed protein product [Caenorhabditis brenneri]
MPKRNMRPLYPHEGYMIRPQKVLSDGSELLHCSERLNASIKCQALGNKNGNIITLTKQHTGHQKNDEIVKSKMAKIEMKEIATTSNLPPRKILLEVKKKYGVVPVVMSGSTSTLNRMISRQREEKCPDVFALDSSNPVFQGKMTLDYDQERFMIFDEINASTGARHVAFGNELGLQVLQNSEILLTDGTFAVAKKPFAQLWSIHATFGDSTVPVVNVLMESRSTPDYSFVLENIKKAAPNWNPKIFMGDLEIGQAKAVEMAFPGIQVSFCYFHLVQAWYRRMSALKLDSLTQTGCQLHEFWTLLTCLPFGNVNTVHQDFDEILKLLPNTVTPAMTKFENYIRKYYVGPSPSLMFPPLKWNVAERTIRGLPRTTNSVEALHRNLEGCISDTRGRSEPHLSELVKCLKEEALHLKQNKEALDFDPLFKVSAERKEKDLQKDKRLLAVVLNIPQPPRAPLHGINYLKAIRAAKKF